MYVGMSKEQEALRDELRAYYDELYPDISRPWESLTRSG